MNRYYKRAGFELRSSSMPIPDTDKVEWLYLLDIYGVGHRYEVIIKPPNQSPTRAERREIFAKLRIPLDTNQSICYK